MYLAILYINKPKFLKYNISFLLIYYYVDNEPTWCTWLAYITRRYGTLGPIRHASLFNKDALPPTPAFRMSRRARRTTPTSRLAYPCIHTFLNWRVRSEWCIKLMIQSHDSAGIITQRLDTDMFLALAKSIIEVSSCRCTNPAIAVDWAITAGIFKPDSISEKPLLYSFSKQSPKQCSIK